MEFSKIQIVGNGVFKATIEATANCTNDLPSSVSEAEVIGRVIAVHQVSGANVTLNSSYTINISPFPSQAGQTGQASENVSLQFPAGSQSGSYRVVGELIEARVKVLLVWISVTSFLPPPQTMGSLTLSRAKVGGGVLLRPPAPTPLAPVVVEPSVIAVSDVVTDEGVFTQDVTTESDDGKVELTIDEGTIGKTAEDEPISEISAAMMAEPPAPPTGATAVGLTYELGPSHLIFGQ